MAPLSRWTTEQTASFELARDLLALPKRHAAGRARALIRIEEELEVTGRVVSRDASALVARAEGSDPRLSPLLLLAHVDVASSDPSAWRPTAGPESAAVVRAELVGRGAMGGPMAAALFASALRRLETPERDIWLVVTADGRDPTATSLARILRRHPQLAAATLALGPGGWQVELEDERVALVSAGELGFTRVELRSHGPASALQLAEALSGLSEIAPEPEVGEAALRYLSDRAETHSWPQSWLMRSPALAELLYRGALERRAWTRPMVRAEARVWLRESEPTEAIAEVRWQLPASFSGPELSARLAHRAEGLAQTRGLATQPELLAVGDERFDALERAFGGGSWARVLGEPSQARLLLAAGVPCFGFLPLRVSRPHVEAIDGPNERVPVASFLSALEALPRALVALGGAASSTTAVR